MWEQLQLFLIFLKSSALAVSGLGSLPLVRVDMVPRFTTDAGIAIDSAAALRPANTPVFSAGTSETRSGQPAAVAAPFPTPASRTTAMVSGRC